MATKSQIFPMDEPDVLKFYVDPEMTQFEEVGGTCSNKDNPDEACCTVRSVVIGLVFVICTAYLHQWTLFTYSDTYEYVYKCPWDNVLYKMSSYFRPRAKCPRNLVLIQDVLKINVPNCNVLC